jgi:hypothetical protein
MSLEPPLIEYQGWVAAWLESAPGEVERYSEERFVVERDRDYVLAVAIQRERFEGRPSAPIDTGEGVSAADVPFRVSVDSGAIALPPVPQDLVVPADGSSRRLSVEFRTPASGDHRIFVYVLQRSRLLQVVEVRMGIRPEEPVC